MDERVKLRMQIEETRSAIRNLEEQIDGIIEQYLPLDVEVWAFEVGHWRCLASPFGLCCYNKFEDPAFDQCIFCGEPNERK